MNKERVIKAVENLRAGKDYKLTNLIDWELKGLFDELGLVTKKADEKIEEISNEATEAYKIVVKNTPSIRNSSVESEAESLEMFINDVVEARRNIIMEKISCAVML